MIDSALLLTAKPALHKLAKSTAQVVGKKILDEGLKKAFNNQAEQVLVTSFQNVSFIEQALFALDLSSSESSTLENFLSSPHFENLVHSIGLIGTLSEGDLPSLQSELQNYLTKILPEKPDAALESLASALIDLITKAADSVWLTATQVGIIDGTWAKDSAVQSLVHDYAANARNSLQQKIVANAAVLADIDVFAERYRRGVAYATSKIKPQSLNEATPVPVSDLYVEPHLNYLSDKRLSECSRDLFFAFARRSVILGNPGGGKSTFAAKLCHDICINSIDSSSKNVPEISALVVLRDYAQQWKSRSFSILEYLESHSKSEYQIEAPAGAFKLLLMSGRILVVFDGLDELIDAKDRLAIVSAVQHFSLEYPIAQIIVTSREVGYEQAPLDREKFSHFKLSPFSAEKVEEYADKWFRHSCYPNMDEARKLKASFIVESALIPDIRSTPLMLGLLCNLYRQDGFIPKNRPEIYQRCADLLFTRWDRSRGINIKLPLDHRIRPAMSYLAHWIYTNEELQAGVKETELIASTTKYLRQWVEDDAEAEAIASQFVEFFRGRAWVFTDTGSDKTQRLYQFTHRTFLEYFTADELARLYPDAQSLHDHLIEKVESRSWDVVCQMAYQISAERTFSHNVLIDLLCARATGKDIQKNLNISSFLSRIIDLLHPTPPKRRQAICRCLANILGNVKEITTDSDTLMNLVREILAGIVYTSEESLKINTSEFASAFNSYVFDTQLDDESKIIIFLFLDDVVSDLFHLYTNGEDIDPAWDAEVNNILDNTRDLRIALGEKDGAIAVLNFWRADVSIMFLAQRFGPGIIFSMAYYPLGGWYKHSISTFLIDRLTVDRPVHRVTSKQLRNQSVFERFLHDGLNIGELLVTIDQWNRSDAPFPLVPWTYFTDRRNETVWPDNPVLCENLIIFLAVCTEYSSEEPSQWNATDGTVADFLSIYWARRTKDALVHAEHVIDSRCRTPTIKDQLFKWCRGLKTFTTLPPRKDSGEFID